MRNGGGGARGDKTLILSIGIKESLRGEQNVVKDAIGKHDVMYIIKHNSFT